MTSNNNYKRIIYTIIFLVGYHSGVSQSSVNKLFDSLSQTNSTIKNADIFFAISTYYSDRLKIDSGFYFANKIKELSQPAGYETGMGKHYLAMALGLYYRGRYGEAEENSLKAIEIFSRQKETSFLGRSFWQLGTINFVSNNIISSRKNYWIAIGYSVSCRDYSGSFRAYYWMARTYYKTAEIDSASFYYIKALAMAEQLKDVQRIQEAACWVGRSFLSLGEFDKAFRYLDYGLKCMPSRDRVSVRFFLEDYITTVILTHDYARVDSAIKEFELINGKVNDAWGRITLNKIKGRLAYEQKNYQDAITFLQQAYSKKDELGGTQNEIKDIVFLLGKAAYETKDDESAIVHLRSAAQLSHGLRYFLEEMEAYLLLSKSFEHSGNADSALRYFRNYSLLKDSALSLQKQKTVIEVTTRYETEKKEQAIKMLQKESEANSYLLTLQDQQLEKQQLKDEKKSQQLMLISKQNEINKLDVAQKTLNLENEKKENEKNQSKLKLLEKEAAYQKLYVEKQRQQKKIVYTGIAAILALSGYGLYRYIRRKKLNNQQVVLNERLRISRELHDELGSTLSGIAMYSHLTREQIKAGKTVEVEKSLNNMQLTSGSMVNKLKDIVWLVNPEQDSMQKLMERLEEYAEEMAMIKNMEVKITIPSKLSAINLPVESRRNIYLFCKEAINNAVKYSDADLIELAMKELDHNKIEFSIADNGKGFEPATVKKGNGLLNMAQRAADINGVFSLKSSPGQGTTISLTCKIT